MLWYFLRWFILTKFMKLFALLSTWKVNSSKVKKLWKFVLLCRYHSVRAHDGGNRGNVWTLRSQITTEQRLIIGQRILMSREEFVFIFPLLTKQSYNLCSEGNFLPSNVGKENDFKISGLNGFFIWVYTKYFNRMRIIRTGQENCENCTFSVLWKFYPFCTKA